jgi:hypothetical protein
VKRPRTLDRSLDERFVRAIERIATVMEASEKRCARKSPKPKPFKLTRLPALEKKHGGPFARAFKIGGTD